MKKKHLFYSLVLCVLEMTVHSVLLEEVVGLLKFGWWKKLLTLIFSSCLNVNCDCQFLTYRIRASSKFLSTVLLVVHVDQRQPYNKVFCLI